MDEEISHCFDVNLSSGFKVVFSGKVWNLVRKSGRKNDYGFDVKFCVLEGVGKEGKEDEKD